jgi:short-subunit dehydrogenase
VLLPEQVADTILRALERGQTEVVVPRYLGVVGVAQALTPRLLSRLVTRASGRA